MSNICIIAGDTSGDIYAGELLASINANTHDIQCQGIAGDQAKAQGMQLWMHNKHMNFMGFTEVLREHRRIINAWNIITTNLENNKPDLLILIDYPGLNLRIAKWAKKRGIKTMYYIPPQVWAWGRGRIKALQQYIDCIAPLYPFEQYFFSQNKVDSTLVRHPLLTKIQTQTLKYLADNQPINILLMPGSRRQEVEKHLDNMLAACFVVQLKLQQRLQISVVQAPSHSPLRSIICAWQDKLHIKVIQSANKQQAFKTAHAACVVSGTASLEIALAGIPLAIVYKTSWLNYTVAKWLLAERIKWIGLPNLIANSTVVPELIQHKTQPESLATTLQKILQDTVYRESIYRGLGRIRSKLDKASDQDITQLVLNQL